MRRLNGVVSFGGAATGAVGTLTFTVADADALPPGPVADNWYDVVLLGNTWRLPLLCTGPSPGSIVTEVASLTDQRRVADCPRSIELGSAGNCAITGTFDGGGGGGVVIIAGGAGGVGGFSAIVFFLHPAASITSKTLIKIVALFRLLNSVLQFEFLLAPNRRTELSNRKSATI